MSITPSDGARIQPAEAGSVRSLFTYEIRRDGRIVATLEGRQSATETTVETNAFPITAPQGAPAVVRPFSFTSIEHARRFADEALVVFEYLNCSVT